MILQWLKCSCSCWLHGPLSCTTITQHSSSSSCHKAQQEQAAAARGSSGLRQQHRADLLSIPAFHQDMLQLLPGGQAYLDAAAFEAAGWGLNEEATAVQLRAFAGGCCHTIYCYLYRHLPSITGQQQLSRSALVVSSAAIRLVLELQLLASGAVERQREQQQQQLQQLPQQLPRQQASTSEDHANTDRFALLTWNLLRLQIRALAATSRSCLPPEVLQQAGLQLLQALAAPLQQWQLSSSGDSFLQNAAAAGALPFLGDALHVLVTAACGAQPTYNQVRAGEHRSVVQPHFPSTATAARLCILLGMHSAPLDPRQRRSCRHDENLHMYKGALVLRAATIGCVAPCNLLLCVLFVQILHLSKKRSSCCVLPAYCVFIFQFAAVPSLRAEPSPGQLPSLAAAHPEAYTALIDCCLRTPLLPADSMLVPGPLLLYASPAWSGSHATLDNTPAVAGLASALTGLAKRAVQRITAAADLQSQPAAAAVGEAAPAPACFSAAAPRIAVNCVARQAGLLTVWFETAAAGSSSSSQAVASAALVAVVYARSLVQLVDAVEAAGPEVYCESLLGRPVFYTRWLNEPAGSSPAGDTYSMQQVHPTSSEDEHNVEGQWQGWQLLVLQVMQHLWGAFKSVGIATSAAAAGEPAAAAAAASTSASGTGVAAASKTLAGDASAHPQARSTSSSTGSTSNSNGSSAGQQVKWGYLLRLQQCSPQWAAAVAAYEASHPNRVEVQAAVLPSTAAAAEQLSQQYAEALGLCRALVAASPLPVVCNNPSCENTDGVSEAAAASKARAGCRCRYCSVACQKADWKRHRGACRRMAAAGQACL
jgi:hypothetical protein